MEQAPELFIPADIRELLDELVEQFKRILQTHLVGVYLHGSLAMGCFNPLRSDVDFLVVVDAKLSADIKQRIIDFALPLSDRAPTKGLEFSVVLQQDLTHFAHPTPFELHFSEMWKAHYAAGTVDLEQPYTDPDLAAHFVITRARGVCLYGKPIADVFPNIPADAYWQSIKGDADDILERIAENPIYSVLNLCRVIAYKTEGLITSKVEGGKWALQHFEVQYHPLITQALREYQSPEPHESVWSGTELSGFAAYVKGLLQRIADVSTDVS